MMSQKIKDKPDYIPIVVWDEYIRYCTNDALARVLERLMLDRVIWRELKRHATDDEAFNLVSNDMIRCALLSVAYIESNHKPQLISKEIKDIESVIIKSRELSKEISMLINVEGSTGELYSHTNAISWQFIAMQEYPSGTDAKPLQDILSCLADSLEEVVDDLRKAEPTYKSISNDVYVKMIIRYLAREFYKTLGCYLAGTIVRCAKAITGKDNIDKKTDVGNALKGFDYKVSPPDFVYGGLMF